MLYQCFPCIKNRQHIKKQRHHFADKGPFCQSCDFSCSHVWMWELDYKESWTLKNWCLELWFWRRLLRVPWTARRSNQILKGDQSWVFIGRTDAEAETPILGPPDVNWLIGKDPYAGQGWMQEKGTTEDEMVGWHHGLDGHEFEQALGVGDGQGSLACCSPWGHKDSDTTEWLNWMVILYQCFLCIKDCIPWLKNKNKKYLSLIFCLKVTCKNLWQWLLGSCKLVCKPFFCHSNCLEVYLDSEKNVPLLLSLLNMMKSPSTRGKVGHSAQKWL